MSITSKKCECKYKPQGIPPAVRFLRIRYCKTKKVYYNSFGSFTESVNKREKTMKEKMKDNLSTILISVFELIVGVLLLIAPEVFTIGIVLLAGGVLMLGGILLSVQYFRMEPKEASKEQLLLKALIRRLHEPT